MRMRTYIQLCLGLVVASSCVVSLACGGGGSPDPATGGSGGTPGNGGSGSTATGGTNTGGGGLGGTGGGSGGCTASCDDGFDCTVDSCLNSKCTHSIGPNSGVTACPAGQYCTVEKGCVANPACATDEQCAESFKGDACKTNIKCDPKSSVCLFDALDKDGDKHPPISCGGDDCDDSAVTIHPGATELCNGKDDDCSGQIDDGATCADQGSICESGKCVDKQHPTGAKINPCPGSTPSSPFCDIYTYDAEGRLACLGRDGDCSGSTGYGEITWCYTYDAQGMVVSAQDCKTGPCENCMTYKRPDASTVLTTRDFSCDGSPDFCYVEKWDAHGNVIEQRADADCDGVADPGGDCFATNYQYDQLGHIEREDWDISCDGTFDYSYCYTYVY